MSNADEHLGHRDNSVPVPEEQEAPAVLGVTHVPAVVPMPVHTW